MLPAYRGRLAPSPTGDLHLGHARTFLIAAQRAAAAGGTLVLRIDDLDTQRARPEYIDSLLGDLLWLGLECSEGLSPLTRKERGAYGPYAQSRRASVYKAALAALRRNRKVYPCCCSRRDLLAASAAPHADDDDEPRYPGTCRGRSDAGCAQDAWRFRVPDGEIIAFEDALAGPQRFIAGRDFGDFVVAGRNGVPSYQLANVVDDAAMNITEVVRGQDLLRSTARQILLLRALGLPQPLYAHCNLVLDEHGTRLAKRNRAFSLRSLRDQGLTAAQVRTLACEATTSLG